MEGGGGAITRQLPVQRAYRGPPGAGPARGLQQYGAGYCPRAPPLAATAHNPCHPLDIPAVITVGPPGHGRVATVAAGDLLDDHLARGPLRRRINRGCGTG